MFVTLNLQRGFVYVVSVFVTLYLQHWFVYVVSVSVCDFIPPALVCLCCFGKIVDRFRLHTDEMRPA